MTRGKKLLLLLVPIGLYVLVVLPSCGGPCLPNIRKKQLVSTCAGADRIVVDPNTWPEESRRKNDYPTLPTFTIEGQEKVKELLAT